MCKIEMSKSSYQTRSIYLLLLALGLVLHTGQLQVRSQPAKSKSSPNFQNATLNEFLSCEAILEKQSFCDTLDLTVLEVAVHDFSRALGFQVIEVDVEGTRAPTSPAQRYRNYQVVCLRGKDTFEIRLLQLPVSAPNSRLDSMRFIRLRDDPIVHYFRARDTSFAGFHQKGWGRFYRDMPGQDHHSLLSVRLSSLFSLGVKSRTTNWLDHTSNYSRRGRIRLAIEVMAKQLNSPCVILNATSFEVNSHSSLAGTDTAKKTVRKSALGSYVSYLLTRPVELSHFVARGAGLTPKWSTVSVFGTIARLYQSKHPSKYRLTVTLKGWDR